MTTETPVPGEDTNLELHVEMCARRHAALNSKMFRVEIAVYLVLAILGGGGIFGLEKMMPLVNAAAQIAGAVNGLQVPSLPQ